MRILAIGDIHGSASQLSALLNLGKLYRGWRVVFLGDFVDVGPDSRAVIELLLAFRKSRADTVFVSV
jgi:serine/threonine protein phosphatase 1